MGIKGAVRRHYERAFKEPVHNQVANGLVAAAIGGWVGGIISSGDGGFLAVLAGFAIAVFAMIAGMWLVPHPDVIVEDWFNEPDSHGGWGDDA